ncbi:MAG: hypothetical protein FWC10_10040 [Lentimicrobiaceae bacterium]|nr:hypothetical protein [Lentimicrobiaceae bacterium]MCL2247428.1 hypothetical protein [Lentimicrobiaceae bacterium]
MGTIKIDKDKMGYFFLMTIIFALLVILGYYIDFKKAPGIRKNVEELYLNGEFSTATNLGGTWSSLNGTTVFDGISYGFQVPVSTKNPRGYQAAGMGSALAEQISKATDSIYKRFVSTVKREDVFLVLYDKNKPKNAILLLDHPIKSDSDFARYKAEIEEKRKDKSWRGYE